MKKRLFLAFILVLVLALAACAGQDGTTGKPDPSTTAGRPEPTTTGTQPHEHIFGDWTIVTEATCTADGLKERTCACGEKETAAIPVTEHVFGDWTVTTAATCTADGLKERVCACGEKETAAIPTTEHDYQNGICSACGEKEPIPSTGLEYELNSDGESYSVSGIGTCTDTDIVIPSVHDGLPVTSIDWGAFYNCSSLTSIAIPDSVTSIGEGAFRGCSSLTSIVIPDSVTSIGKGAFSGCSSLTSIMVADGNSTYHSEGSCLIETASKTLIAGCSTSVIPTDGSVTSIGDFAFSDCRSLTSIVIPDSVTSIGDGAFYECSSLTSVTIGNGVTSIGWYAFSDCSSLNAVHISDLAAWCNISFYDDDSNPLCYAKNLYINGELATDIVIPDSVTSIGWYAFSGCSSLTSITFSGTKAQWNAISKFKGEWWDTDIDAYTIHCTDGDIEK